MEYRYRQHELGDHSSHSCTSPPKNRKTTAEPGGTENVGYAAVSDLNRWAQIVHSRVVILGNAGSGKSHLAAAIATAWCLPAIDLDSIFWMTGGYTQKRPADAVHSEIAKRKAEERWLFEGVYGELIALVLDRATFLVWLDIDWQTCRASILERRMRSTEDERRMTEGSFQALLDYAGAYWSREGPHSQHGHRSMFEQFPNEKCCFRTREEVSAFIRSI